MSSRKGMYLGKRNTIDQGLYKYLQERRKANLPAIEHKPEHMFVRKYFDREIDPEKSYKKGERAKKIRSELEIYNDLSEDGRYEIESNFKPVIPRGPRKSKTIFPPGKTFLAPTGKFYKNEKVYESVLKAAETRKLKKSLKERQLQRRAMRKINKP